MSSFPKLVRPLLNRAAPVIGRRSGSSAPAARDVYSPTYNDLPKPKGSFVEAQKKRDLQYRLHFVGGLAFLLGTVYYMYIDEDMFLNFSPPELPEDLYGKRPKRSWLNIFKND